jgi:hypothetical protein
LSSTCHYYLRRDYWLALSLTPSRSWTIGRAAVAGGDSLPLILKPESVILAAGDDQPPGKLLALTRSLSCSSCNYSSRCTVRRVTSG